MSDAAAGASNVGKNVGKNVGANVSACVSTDVSANVTIAASALSLTVPGSAEPLLYQADLQCRPGELWCIVGPNGAGKSTLLETLAGLRTPHAGRIEIDGRLLQEWSLTTLARRRAFMPQRQEDTFAVTVFERVLTARHPYLSGWQWEGAQERATVMTALAAVDMAHLANRDVRHISGGERQRVAIAAMLAQGAPLMLSDEPLAHLDLPHQVACLRLLQTRVRNFGDVILFVCHDLNLAHAFATHAFLMDGKGRWHAGRAADVLTAERLSAAFAYPIRLLRDGERSVFAPDLA